MAKPTIRFRGFDDEWEQRKVSELTKELTEYATMESGLPLLTSARSGIMYQSEYRGNTTTENSDTLFSVVPISACTYRHMSDDDTFHLNINNLEKGLVSREYPVFIASGDNDLNFLVQHINSNNRFLSFCKQQKKGGTRTRLYYKVLCDFELMVPKPEEQREISVYFRQLDNLITLHQRKCDETKKLKKYMLQKMFPQNGSKVPEIRFKGFTDEWEQRKLGDYCDMYNGDRSSKYPNAQDMVAEGIPFINAGDLENGHVNLTTCNKISREKYDDLGGAKLQIGDIVYCLRGTLGKNAYIDNFPEGTVASSLVAIRPKNIDGRYLFHVLNSDIEYSQRVVHDEGAAQPNLSAKSVSGFMIPIPHIDEQKKVSKYFDNLDYLITLHQHKCEELKKLKKFMLQNMFA